MTPSLRALHGGGHEGPDGAVASATYNDLRYRHILVERDRERDALRVLLRFEAAERPGTRDVLRRLGFQPDAAPENRSISWCRWVPDGELDAVCRSLCDALGEDAVLDLGACFGSEPGGAAKLPSFWPGRFVVHVGGTRRCIVFGASADRRELTRTFDDARAAYYERDFVPATE